VLQRSWIYAHRGIWRDKNEANSISAINRAHAEGFGIETDVRWANHEMIISHDLITTDSVLSFRNSLFDAIPVAINIKTDGLQPYLKEFIINNGHRGTFVFDGSIPEMVKYRAEEISHALRLSEYEKDLPWNPDFIWVDGFEVDWWIRDRQILQHLEDTPIVFVSPELHGREHRTAWEWLLDLKKSGTDNLYVCTDFPEELMAAYE
jgi:glycerophosphoryl diester phosphodiesterase